MRKINTAAENIPSCKLLKKLGMTITDESIGSFCKDENFKPDRV